MRDKKFLFEQDKVSHALFVMALPTIISQLIMLIYNMADTWFIGRTNDPYMVASCTLSSMLRSIGISGQASFGLSMGGLLNIALDPLFMFVILPDGKQVMGAAIATMLSNTFAFLYFAIVYWRAGKTTILSFRLREGIPSGKSFVSIFAVGIPAAVSVLLFDLCSIVINRLSAGHGDIELAAIGIVMKAERLPLNIGIGICLGMVPLVIDVSMLQHGSFYPGCGQGTGILPVGGGQAAGFQYTCPFYL